MLRKWLRQWLGIEAIASVADSMIFDQAERTTRLQSETSAFLNGLAADLNAHLEEHKLVREEPVKPKVRVAHRFQDFARAAVEAQKREHNVNRG